MGDLMKVVVPCEVSYEGCSLEEIHDSLINGELFEGLPGLFDHFSFWGFVQEEGSYFGKDWPDTIKKEAAGWNPSIKKQAAKAIEALLATGDTPEEMVERLSACLFPLYDIRTALDALDNHLTYGSEGVVCTDDGCFYRMMPDDVLNDILAHPERWAVITVVTH